MKKDPKLAAWILLASYSFHQGSNELEQLINSWIKKYPGKWIIAAIVEAIYQGRYKVDSVSKILESWSIRGYPVHHFDHEFADIVCKRIDIFHDKKIVYMNQKGRDQGSESKEHQNKKNTELNAETHTHLPNPNIKNLEKLVIKLTA
jgi:hypothetical protein